MGKMTTGEGRLGLIKLLKINYDIFCYILTHTAQTVSVHTQTPTNYDATRGLHPLLTPHPPTPYYVLQKASERGQRVECRHVSVPTEIDLRESYPRWDLPRSHRHKARNVDSRVLSKLMYEKKIFLLQC